MQIQQITVRVGGYAKEIQSAFSKNRWPGLTDDIAPLTIRVVKSKSMDVEDYPKIDGPAHVLGKIKVTDSGDGNISSARLDWQIVMCAQAVIDEIAEGKTRGMRYIKAVYVAHDYVIIKCARDGESVFKIVDAKRFGDVRDGCVPIDEISYRWDYETADEAMADVVIVRDGGSI